MVEQIQEVQSQGFKPVVYIDESLLGRLMHGDHELVVITREAKKLNVPVYNENDIPLLNRIHKAFVFRYGVIPISTEAMVKRKGGKIISGNLVVQR